MKTIRTLYREIASTIDARLNCIASGNTDWQSRHEDKLNELADFLPSGSGIDNGTAIDWQASTGEKLVLITSYHTMDEYGGYSGWIDDIVITVRASMIHGITLTITGKFGKRQDVKEYLYDEYQSALTQKIVYTACSDGAYTTRLATADESSLPDYTRLED